MRDALERGFYDDLLGIELTDGRGVMPREVATLVHTGSTVIVDAVTERCLAAGENIVLEGTFSWPGLGRRLLSDLAEADYQKLTILLCRSAERDHQGSCPELVAGLGDCSANHCR
ncbi:hypothetical protein [Rhodococcus erythropolis]|uniref:hypothetical protein n=1 Tax=Rhodococcus erythropolis TaxID=1833 RepID=UPI000F738DA3|nr:hypothetical protein [Rhodococcus erythropolis]